MDILVKFYAVDLPMSLKSARFDLPEGVVYEVHVLKVPKGYEKNTDEFRTLDVYSDLAIVVNKAA